MREEKAGEEKRDSKPERSEGREQRILLGEKRAGAMFFALENPLVRIPAPLSIRKN